jgi:hypothetical protein
MATLGWRSFRFGVAQRPGGFSGLGMRLRAGIDGAPPISATAKGRPAHQEPRSDLSTMSASAPMTAENAG